MFKKLVICVLFLSFISSAAFAEKDASVSTKAGADYQYYLLEPDIIANYVSTGSRVGFVRITVELMVNSSKNYALVESNAPLIRDKIITVLGEQTREIIRSVTEREDIRLLCLGEINDALFTEIGEKPVEDLLFTKYLYQ